VIIRATKSQIFSALFKAYEMSTNKISHSYHEGIPIIRSKKSQNLPLGQNLLLGQTFWQHSFFLFIDILLKIQQQILKCFCNICCNSVIIMNLLWFLT